MFIYRNVVSDKDGSYIEAIFESSNILKTTYFPHKEKLFIHFIRGNTFSYSNISETLYKEFEECDSQGKFFSKKIQNNRKYFFSKEYKLTEGEIKEAKKIISEHKEK